MGITIPGYHLKASSDLPELRKHLKSVSNRRSVHRELALTSMIDIMSVIVLFLIQSFSATGEVFMVNSQIHIPDAYHARTLNRAPIVTVQPDKVSLEGATVGDNQNIKDKIEESDWELPKLSQRLSEYRAFFESVHQGVKFPGDVIIQADKNLDFVYLKRVMYTLAKLGYSNISLAVRGEAQGPPQNVENEVSDEASESDSGPSSDQ
jgi:biopolymer transport protein ExbD